jgi:hypothetical protein
MEVFFCFYYRERDAKSPIYQGRCMQTENDGQTHFNTQLVACGSANERPSLLLRIKSKDQSEDEQMLRRRQRNHARRNFTSPEETAALSA